MAKVQFGSTKRYGTRYGHTLRQRLGKIEAQQKKKHTCPYCNKPKARWQAVGIFHCDKCNSTFTGRAYSPNIRKDISTQKKDSLIFARKASTEAEE